MSLVRITMYSFRNDINTHNREVTLHLFQNGLLRLIFQRKGKYGCLKALVGAEISQTE
jgi:hypothetical protein